MDHVSVRSLLEENVHDTKNGDSRVDHYCGTNVPTPLKSDGNIMMLTFVSNEEGTCRGFNASFTSKEGI